MGKIVLCYEGSGAKVVSTYGNREYEDFIYLQQHLDQCYGKQPQKVSPEDIAENKELLEKKK
jgi:hypothetical protein